jgi:hypothetical protein
MGDDVAVFFRSLRSALGGSGFPCVWVPEWHKTDHGLRVHFAVGQYTRRQMINRAWGHGFVHIRRLGDLAVGSTTLHEARRAADYLSKYVSKSFEDDPARQGRSGLHRYEVAQGFQPPVRRLRGRSSAAVLAQAVQVMGAAPSSFWSSSDADDWQGPPAVWAAWG